MARLITIEQNAPDDDTGAGTFGALGDPIGPDAWIDLQGSTENGASVMQNVNMDEFGEGVPYDATGGAVVLGHELGHALGWNDPVNVRDNENPIRGDLGVNPRPSYHGDPIPP